jgi:hypothetical protein
MGDGFGRAVSICDVPAAPGCATTVCGIMTVPDCTISTCDIMAMLGHSTPATDASHAPSFVCSFIDTVGGGGGTSLVGTMAAPALLLPASNVTLADSLCASRRARVFFDAIR